MATKLARRIETAFHIVASVLMAGLVAITFVDVVGRQFGAPLTAAFELTEIAFGTLFYVALPFVTFHREHVTVDLLPLKENEGIGRVIALVVDLASAALLSYAAYQLWQQANTLARFHSVTMFLGWSVSPIVRLMSVLALLSAVLCAVMAVMPKPAPSGPVLGIDEL